MSGSREGTVRRRRGRVAVVATAVCALAVGVVSPSAGASDGAADAASDAAAGVRALVTATDDVAATLRGLVSAAVDDSDPDGDGLSTAVERLGYSVDAAGNVTPGRQRGQTFVNLPAMGANPLHKDLFVHVDHMDAGWKLPEDSAARAVREAFTNAPLANPDGRTGVALHLDQGPDSVMNPRTGEKWGSWSRAGLIPFEAFSDVDVDVGRYAAMTPAGRPAGHAASGRAFAFRYSVMAHEDPSGSDGIARGIPSSEFLVTLGARDGGSLLDVATTFIHELGHTIGLRHGGAEHEPYAKPNYQSLMSYAYAFEGLERFPDGKHVLDFSRHDWDVDENALDETATIPDGRYYISNQYLFPPYLRAVFDSKVDWSGDDVIGGTISHDLDGSGDLTPLSGHKDWQVGTGPGQITFKGGAVGAMTPADAAKAIETMEPVTEKPAPPSGSGAEAGLEAGPAPIADIVADKFVGAAPLTVNFDASASTDDGTIVAYNWSFGDGDVGSGATVAHTFTTPGTYTVELGVVDDDGVANELVTTHTVEVKSSNAAPIASIHRDLPRVDPNQAVTFDATTSVDDDGSIVTYQWAFGDGSTASGATATHAYAALGTYDATLTVTDEDGATDVETVTTVVALNVLPTAAFSTSSVMARTGHTIGFDARSSVDPDGEIVSYGWTFGDGTTASGPVVNHVYTTAGFHPVELTITDDRGGTARASTSIAISVGPTPLELFQWAAVFTPIRVRNVVAQRTSRGTAFAVQVVGWGAHAQSMDIHYLGSSRVKRRGKRITVFRWKKIGTVHTGPDGTAWFTLRTRLKPNVTVRVTVGDQRRTAQVAPQPRRPRRTTGGG